MRFARWGIGALATFVVGVTGLCSADCLTRSCDEVGCFDQLQIAVRSPSRLFDTSAGTKYVFSFTASDGSTSQVACDARIQTGCSTSLGRYAQPVDIQISGEPADGAMAIDG